MRVREKAEGQSSFESGGDLGSERVSKKALTRKLGCMSYKPNERLVRTVELAIYFETEAAWSCGDETENVTHHHNCNKK